jgi:hypothetical protein
MHVIETERVGTWTSALVEQNLTPNLKKLNIKAPKL